MQPAKCTRRLATSMKEQHVQPFQPDGVDGEEIHRDHALRLRAQKLAPRKTAALACWAELFRKEHLVSAENSVLVASVDVPAVCG